jgi:hypothetical protein
VLKPGWRFRFRLRLRLHHEHRVEGRALVLHVGIHKTASTYIQHRLKANRLFLRQNRLFYPRRRCDHLELVKALRQGNLQPWEQLLHSAGRQGCHPLVSAEILSLVLIEPSRQGRGTLLADLLQMLTRMGIQLELVAFIRDQPTYLNSRYTQLLKRFYLSSTFARYVQQTLIQGGESHCDYMEIFSEALDRPEVSCHFLPFRTGEADPCERLLQVIGVSDLDGLKPLHTEANIQPGWQAVWIAQRVTRQLVAEHPQVLKSASSKLRMRERLERMALEQGWQAEPFQGLTESLLIQIEERYGISNDLFARRVWDCGWRDLFPRPIPPAMPMRPRSRQERQELLALAAVVLAEGTQSDPAMAQA